MAPIRKSLKLVVWFFWPLFSYGAEQGLATIPRPNNAELERIVGNRLETSARVKAWKAPEPQSTNLFLYSVSPFRVDEVLMRRVAEYFGIKGDIEQIKGDTLGHIGFQIYERNPTNAAKARGVSFWLTMGNFEYSSGDDGYAWDLKNHQPLMKGVPDKESAKAKAIELLPLLGLSTNDLEHYSTGRLRWQTSENTVGFTDRVDKQRKRATMMRTVTFFQRVSGGGTTVSVGNGGQVRFSFVSEGKVGSIEWFFRKMTKAGEVKPKTSKDIISDMQKGKAWTWHEYVPASMTVTDCVLAYPQGNSWLLQDYIWPFYMLTGKSADGRTVTLYVPLEW